MSPKKSKSLDFAKVSKRAFELWEKEGHPHGRDKEHWEQASRELQIEQDHQKPDTSDETPAPPTSKTRRDRSRTPAAREPKRPTYRR